MTEQKRILTSQEAKEFMNAVGSKSNSDKLVLTDCIFPERMGWKGLHFVDVSFDNVDFSAPIFESSFFSKFSFNKCRFENVSFAGADFKKVEIKDCLFEKSVIGNKSSSFFDSCVFENSVFENTSFNNTRFTNCRFINCKFDKISGKQIRWERCYIEKTDITGSVETFVIIDTKVINTDLSGCTFVDSAILPHPESINFKLPSQTNNFFVNPKLFLEAKDKLKNNLSNEGYEKYTEIAEILATSKYLLSVDKKLFNEFSPVDEDAIILTLKKIRDDDKNLIDQS